MSARTCLTLLTILCLVGSLVTFFGTNLLMTDLANMYYTSLNQEILSSFPFFIFSLDFVIATLYVIRLFKHPAQRRALARLYSILLAVFSVAGLVFCFLAAIMVYGRFTAPYPFVLYIPICLTLHAVLLVIALVVLVHACSKMTPDTDRRHVKVKYVGYTVMLSLLTFFAYNRFGALLSAVFYAQASTLYLTFPFYLSLLLPLALLIYVIGNFMGLYTERPSVAVWIPVLVLLADLILGAAVVYTGWHNTLFISAISPALGLERLATMPYDTILMVGGVAVLSIYYAIFAVIYNRKVQRRTAV